MEIVVNKLVEECFTMNEIISNVFHKNIHILDWISKAVIYFREGRYDDAIEAVAEVSEDITQVADVIEKNREYFDLVSVDSIAEMLEGILNAKHSQDFVLLADLLELQMESFLCNVQSYIMKKEDLFFFDESRYLRQIGKLKAKIENNKQFLLDFSEEINPAQLLEDGYRIELTSCGLMTVVKRDHMGIAHYLHTNHKISQEAFLLARSFIRPEVDTYVVAGLGLGYHVLELNQLVPKAKIKIMESDMNIIKLCCAFSNIEKLLDNPNITFRYDYEGNELELDRVRKTENEALCIHYPSYRLDCH